MFHIFIISLNLKISKRSVGRRCPLYSDACASRYGERLASVCWATPVAKMINFGPSLPRCEVNILIHPEEDVLITYRFSVPALVVH